MLLLAFDTTVAACSVALVRDGVAVGGARREMEQGQAEALFPMIEGVMAVAGVSYTALDRIAVTVGPGSFTGVRVGLAAARALGLAAGKPVVGATSLEVLAAAVPETERGAHASIVAAIDTKRGDVYVQAFDAHTLAAKTDPTVLQPKELAAWPSGNCIVAGDAAAAFAAAVPGAAISSAGPLPDAVILARIGAARAIDPAGPLPLYILPPKITLAPHGGRLRP